MMIRTDSFHNYSVVSIIRVSERTYLSRIYLLKSCISRGILKTKLIKCIKLFR